MSNPLSKFRIYFSGLVLLWNTGLEVFASRTDFVYWLLTPHFFFDQKTPIRHLKSLKGIVHVRQALRAIEHSNGHFSLD